MVSQRIQITSQFEGMIFSTEIKPRYPNPNVTTPEIKAMTTGKLKSLFIALNLRKLIHPVKI